MQPETCRSRAAAPTDAGFTLLELLIAITLVAVISVLLSSGLHFGARVWERSGERRQAWSDMATAYQFISSRLNTALPITAIGDAKSTVVTFDGTAKNVTFINADLGNAGFLGDQVLDISVAGGNDQAEIIVRRWAYARDFPHVTGAVETLAVLGGLSRAEISYFGTQQIGLEDRWSDDWHDAQAMPRLVKVTLETLKSSGKPVEWVFSVPAK